MAGRIWRVLQVKSQPTCFCNLSNPNDVLVFENCVTFVEVWQMLYKDSWRRDRFKISCISYRKFLPVISVRNPLSHCGINDWPSVSLFDPTLPVWLCWGINIFIFLLCAQGMSMSSPKWMAIKKLIPLIIHTSNLLSPITWRPGGVRMMLSLHRSLVNNCEPSLGVALGQDASLLN